MFSRKCNDCGERMMAIEPWPFKAWCNDCDGSLGFEGLLELVDLTTDLTDESVKKIEEKDHTVRLGINDDR